MNPLIDGVNFIILIILRNADCRTVEEISEKTGIVLTLTYKLRG